MSNLIELASRRLLPAKFFRSLEKRFKPGASKVVSKPAHEAIEDRRTALYGRGNVPFLLNINELRYSGGMAFSYEQHHFMKFLASGRTALQEYYSRHQPKDVFEQHFLTSLDSSLCPMTYPWHSWHNVYMGESGLCANHGRQHYGPCSDEKIALESFRLDRLLHSIQQNGYDPQMSGHIRGYLLLDQSRDDGYRFVVCGGQHRAAVLAHLGYSDIPVTFQPDWPRIICVEHVSDWPLVHSGRISQVDAERIFSAYFRSTSTVLLS